MAGFQRTSTLSQSRQHVDERRITAMAAIIFLAILILAGVAVLLGRTPDTRNSEFSVGKLIAPRAASDAKSR
jgi:hypothetical protein